MKGPLPDYGFGLALTIVLGTASSLAAQRPLPPAEAKFKKENLKKIDGSWASVLGDSGSKIWKEAIRIASDYEDAELMDRMLDAGNISDGAPAEMIPEYLFEVYQRNPGFYVKRALVHYKGKMDEVAGEFVNEMTAKSAAELQGPARKVSRSDPNFMLIQDFLKSARKLEGDMDAEFSAQKTEICRSQSYPIGKTVTFSAETQCKSTYYVADGIFLGVACLTSPQAGPIIINDAKIEKPSKIEPGPCGKRRTFTGQFVPGKPTGENRHPFLFRLEKMR